MKESIGNGEENEGDRSMIRTDGIMFIITEEQANIIGEYIEINQGIQLSNSDEICEKLNEIIDDLI